MHITWNPEDGQPPQTFEFDPDDLYQSEAARIEKAFGQGMTFDQWFEALRVGSASARKVLLWHLLRIEHPGVRFEDTPDFRKRQLKVEMSVAELTILRDRINKTKMDETMREAMQAAFDLDIADAMERETGVVSGDVVETGVALPKQA